MGTPEFKWGWQMTNVDKMEESEIKTLLINRYCDLKEKSFEVPYRVYLKENYYVEDEDLTSFNEMTIKELKVELKLRYLNDKYGGENGKKSDLIQRLQSYKGIPSSPSKMPELSNKILVYGYIRKNEVVLEQGLFIPHYLKEIVVAFTPSNYQTVIALSLENPNYLFITNIGQKVPNKNTKAKIININARNTWWGHRNSWSKSVTARANSIKLPSKQFDAILKHKKYVTNDFEVLFKETTHNYTLENLSKMYVIHRNEWESEHAATAFQLSLPLLKRQSKGDSPQSFVYDDDYGLITFSFSKKLSCNKLWSLSFKSKEYQQQKEWKWQQFNQRPGSQLEGSSGVIIRTDDDKKKLFVCGGDSLHHNNNHNYSPKVMIFDFENKSWSTIKNKAQHRAKGAALCYDNMKQRIFIGGGINKWERESVRIYDLNKNVWDKLPNTWMCHGRHPIMWIDRYNHNLLFMASTNNDSLEYIDLRESNRKWNIARCGGRYNPGFSDMFGLEEFEEKDQLWVAKY